ncbi:MAG TPA: hypothetical protein VEA80_02040 [Vitreimonas sp.]|uniref:hypothetical protein n=1 Tax=Vitreimonas sp. TaxID=3069702 RepID=UPI002D4BA11C|nr:hypothetical protein [Vitreimonas sp.]HYD86231.1 hypothetical protein [Vitreimonas sp.]
MFELFFPGAVALGSENLTDDCVRLGSIDACNCPTCLEKLTTPEWLRLPHFLYEIVIEPMDEDAIASSGEAFDLIQHLRYTLPADRPDLVRLLQGRELGEGHTTMMVTVPSRVDEFETILDGEFTTEFTALRWHTQVMATRRQGRR